jgi:PKD repeat protein
MLASSCAGGGLLPFDSTDSPATSDGPPDIETLELLLHAELSQLGIDGSRAAAMAPGANAAVFDLSAAITEAVGDDPAGVALDWTYRSPGDYDLNGEVNISDLSSIVVFWGSQIAYDDPDLHDGIDYWPSGQPDDFGEAGPGEPPATGSGAENWRAAQADGDSNGEISISDITPIAVAFNTAIQRYNVYLREAGTAEFARVGEVAVEKPESPLEPLRLSYFYEYTPETAGLDLEFIVRPENTALEAEGFDSNIALAGDDPYAGLPAVELSADVSAGSVPLTVELTATAELVPDTTVVSHEWDFDGDGDFEQDTETVNVAGHTYALPGIYVARLRLTDSDGRTALAGVVITAGEPPVASFQVDPFGGEVPVTLEFDGRFSYSALGDVVRYEWDLDGDGFFETDRRALFDLEVEFTAAGAVDVGLRVTDDIGLTGESYVTLEFTDDYEEIEPNSLALTATNLGLIELGAPSQLWRANIGAFGYDGDEIDWFSFSVDEGADGSFSLDLHDDDALFSVQLIDTNTFSVLHELPGVTADVDFSHGIRGAGTYFLRIENLNTVTGKNYNYELGLELTELVYDETENNDTVETANDLGTLESNLLPSTWGSLGPEGYDGDDDDWFKFTLESAGTVTVLLDFFHHEADLELAVYDDTADVIYGVSESVSDKEEVEVELDIGTYSIRCYRRDGDSANYELELFLKP